MVSLISLLAEWDRSLTLVQIHIARSMDVCSDWLWKAYIGIQHADLHTACLYDMG